MTLRVKALGLVALLPLFVGCAEYNTDCTGLVENPDEEIGFLGEDVPLERQFARHANNALGQLAADAMLNARTSSSGNTPTELGVFNGGGIRSEGICVTRTRFVRGALRRGELHEVILFSNVVTVVDLTAAEVRAMFENSVSLLLRDGEPLVPPSGSGRFLQISAGSSLTVDCSQPVGSRITALDVAGRNVLTAGPEEHFRVALSSFLLSGGDGYSMLAGLANDPTRAPLQAQEFGGSDARLTAEFLNATYPPETSSSGPGLRVEPRITFVGCAQP